MHFVTTLRVYYFYNMFIIYRKCPYREPRLFVGVAPGLLSPRDLEVAEKLGADLASELIKDGALEIMSAAKKHIAASIS